MLRSIHFCVWLTLSACSLAEEPVFYLGGRHSDDLPPLTEAELATPQQQALLAALGGDPYGHRAGEHARAGCPQQIRPHALPSNTRHYLGYWVGGGAPVLGSSPAVAEGTFGWDFFGIAFPKFVDLNWTHGRRYQGGMGAYRTDGPRFRSR